MITREAAAQKVKSRTATVTKLPLIRNAPIRPGPIRPTYYYIPLNKSALIPLGRNMLEPILNAYAADCELNNGAKVLMKLKHS